jgi:hypothetical protein
MILACLTNCHVLPCDGGVRKNPIEQLKKNRFDFYRCLFSKDSLQSSCCRNRFGPGKNPIPTLKKRRFDFYTRPTDLFLSTCLDRSSQRKNFPNTDAWRWRNTTGIDAEIASSVTTRHMFWSNERRKRGFLLPIRLPNPSLLASKRNRVGREGGGGGQAVEPSGSAMTDKLPRNFLLKGSPAPFMLALKKAWLGKRRFRPDAADILR